MSVTLDLPEDVVRRLTAEAARRGTELADVVADLANRLPEADRPSGRRLAFVAAGASDAGITPRMDGLLADGFGRD
jgi:lysophospholipase L1-like esterase